MIYYLLMIICCCLVLITLILNMYYYERLPEQRKAYIATIVAGFCFIIGLISIAILLNL